MTPIKEEIKFLAAFAATLGLLDESGNVPERTIARAMKSQGYTLSQFREMIGTLIGDRLITIDDEHVVSITADGRAFTRLMNEVMQKAVTKTETADSAQYAGVVI